MLKLSTALVAFLFVLPAFASSIDDRFEELRDSGEKYQIVGTVCEQVAKLEMAAEYPAPQYEVVTGIAYRSGDKTIGELDVVVFEAATQNAIIVSEVKCWNNLNGALHKAHEQRARFQKTLKKGIKLKMECTDHSCRYTEKNFRNIQNFSTIAQQGATDYGFDRELEFPLDQLMELRARLMTCQEQGECKRPN